MIDTLPAGWLTETEVAALRLLAKDRVVIEVGAWLGRSTVAMASTAKLVISIDHHRGSVEHQAAAAGTDQYAPGLTDPMTGEHSTLRRFIANTAPYPNIIPIVAPFERVNLWLRGGEMAFIDAQHDHESVVRDARLVTACIGPRAPIVFHDYGRWHGVVSAVDYLKRLWGVPFEHIGGTTLAVLR